MIKIGGGIIAGLLIFDQFYIEGEEYLSRTRVGYDGILLALASGAAAVLSLTAGISSAMVGVMVAVAVGLALGAGLWSDAYGAFMLLSMNVICINIAAKLVFYVKGISPRKWHEKKRSLITLRLTFTIWGVLLGLLVVLIYFYKYY